MGNNTRKKNVFTHSGSPLWVSATLIMTILMSLFDRPTVQRMA